MQGFSLPWWFETKKNPDRSKQIHEELSPKQETSSFRVFWYFRQMSVHQSFYTPQQPSLGYGLISMYVEMQSAL